MTELNVLGSQVLFRLINKEIDKRSEVKRNYYYNADFHAEIDMFYKAMIKVDKALSGDDDHEKILKFLIEGWFRHWPEKRR